MKTVHIQYFALLREQRGLAKETLSTAAPDAAALYSELGARHGFTLPVTRLRAAINGDFTPWPAPLKDNDEIVFIPPVAGG
ncbi:MAG: MoaD/ThiS family protein [Opitutaceae bacterium]|jgi:molybdopterin converting factor small subunit